MSWFLVALVVCLVGTAILPGPARAATQKVMATKDAYVLEYWPTDNNGGKDWVIGGDYIGGFAETYLYFDTTARPEGWTKAEVHVDLYYISATVNITASQVTQEWGEYTITWANKPPHGEVLGSVLVTSGDYYTFDVTAIAGGDNISICLNASDGSVTNYFQGAARENGYNEPYLVWTYPVTIGWPGGGWVVAAVLAGAIAMTIRRRHHS